MRYQYENFLLELGAKLRKMRTDQGWTLRQMIVEHGFHLAQWQGFEKGKGISVPTLLRLCEIFNLTLEELVAGLGRQEDESVSTVSAATEGRPAAKKALTPAESRQPRVPRKS